MTTAEQTPELDQYDFDCAVSLRARPSTGPEGRVYDGELSAGWVVGGGVNGGMLLAVGANALRETFLDVDHPDPFSISAYYLSASSPGPVVAATDVVRHGRSMSTGTVSLTQDVDGVPHERVRAMATYVDLSTLPADVATTATAPELPDPEQCIGADLAPADFRANAPMLERFDLRLDPDTIGWALGKPSGRGRIQGWYRLADGREPDPISLLQVLDALPPVTFDLGLPGWAPTLELTAHVRAVPAPGWLKVLHYTRNFAGGMLEEDAEVWDSTGRLVAQSRQLARAPRQA